MKAFLSASEPCWYVVQTKPKQEFRALEQLENQQYTGFLPTLKVEKVRRGKSEIVAEPLFSRYLFIQLDMVLSNWSSLRSTRGVSKLLEFGRQFFTVPDAVITVLRKPSGAGHAPLFGKGELVSVTSSPFAGLEGIYQMSDGEARAMVLIELISQPQKLTFRLDELRKAG